jgi:predicted metal-binding membrane protein
LTRFLSRLTLLHTVNVETVIRRDRAVAGFGLAGLAVLAWLYLIRMAGQMREMDMAPTMPMPGGSDAGYFLLTFSMWAIMMVAMMIPAASPMILTFAAINRRRATDGGATVPLATFLAGYLVMWSAFSLAAAALQWALQVAALMSAATLKAAPFVGAVLLIGAGIYQFTPLKDACLARCRSPFHFIMTEWREGARGAFVMGVRHGAFCVGCCWALMALLFVAGVMNLLWVAGIAAFVLVEKLVPPGRLVSGSAGVILLAWGAWVLLTGLMR